MLYSILKPIMKTALWLYFGRIEVTDAQNIDNGKPTLILANHTASFMDAIITACYIKRKICFFTRGDVFKNPLIAKILRSLGMLPVYRLSEGRDKLHLNDNSNEEALNILSRGGAVLIFCEGASDIAKVLKPLKKGPFRLAAIANSTLEESPVIVPFGINYTHPTEPFGEVFLVGAKPISASSFTDSSATGLARSATEMMRITDTALAPLVWHMEEPGIRQLATAMFVFLKELKPDYSFAESQLLINALNKPDSPEFGMLFRDLEDYRLWQRHYPVHSSQYLPKPGFVDAIIFLIGLPIAAYAVITNCLPIIIARWIVSNKVREPDFIAAVFVSIATILMITWYLICLFICLKNGDSSLLWWNPVCFAIAGLFFLKIYRPAILRIGGWIRRILYTRANSSHHILERLHSSILNFIQHAISA